ncbi:MAG: glycoside hydrolase family 28 protein [Patiriisocius sp.]|uniref:glycoside hydrolase family 28 protein n=1 Tax=Patiriisocius sp. TaxID=2822396 RepID=UPI003EF42275
MKAVITIFSLITFICQPLKAQFNEDQQEAIKAIEKSMSLPEIPDFKINILELGAKNDGVTDCKKAFDKAIRKIRKNNGGQIIVPKGNYKINGPLHLVSNLNLHLKEGSRLIFGSNPKDYPLVLTSWEGTMLYNYSPMIYGNNINNVSITGTGTIDGDAKETWNTWKELQEKSQKLSRDMNHNQVDVEERIFGNTHFLRPQLIQFLNSETILIEDVTITNAPFWCVHILKSNNVTLRGLKYNAYNKNNDGIDIEQSSNILIENVAFDNADDNIAIKAGRDDDGRLSSDLPSQNIIIRNNKFKGLHAIVIGSEMSAGVKNVYAYNCQTSGYVKRGIYLKTNSDRGGYIKNINVDNVDFGDVEDAFYITSNYHGEGSGNFPSKISHLVFSNLKFKNVSNTAIVIEGYPNFKVENVTFTNINIQNAKNAMTLTNTENVIFNEVIIGEKQGVPSAVH